MEGIQMIYDINIHISETGKPKKLIFKERKIHLFGLRRVP